jgi:hypothetical protein
MASIAATGQHLIQNGVDEAVIRSANVRLRQADRDIDDDAFVDIGLGIKIMAIGNLY